MRYPKILKDILANVVGVKLFPFYEAVQTNREMNITYKAMGNAVVTFTRWFTENWCPAIGQGGINYYRLENGLVTSFRTYSMEQIGEIFFSDKEQIKLKLRKIKKTK